MRALAVLLAALAFAPAASAAEALAVRAEVAPATVGFGDPFTYSVEVRGGDAAGSVRIVADTGPFATLAPARTERDGNVVRLVQTLACLDLDCAPQRTARRVELPRARAIGPGGSTGAAVAVSVSVAPRVPAAAVAAPRANYRIPDELPAATTRVAPGALEAGLWVAAALLAAAALAVVALPLLRRQRGPTRRGRERALARALRLLRESAARAAPDRRRAADLVARTLDDDALAGEATRVAWSKREPVPDDARELAGRVEERA
jgi:hypothetical protein